MTSSDVLPFPPTPSASIAGRTVQESVYAQRERPRRLPEDAPNILIVLIDDAGPGLPSTFGGEVRTDTLTRIHRGGGRVQPVPHHRDVLADAGVAADRPQPAPDRQRADRGAGQRLGRLRRGDPEEQRAGRRGAAALRLRDRGVRQVAQHPGAGDDGRPGRSTTGRPASGSSTSTASSPARRRSTSRTWCGTPPPCCRRRRPRRATTSARTWPTTPSAGCTSTRRSGPTSRSSCTGPAAACTAPTTWRRSGRTSTPASSTTAGTPTASGSSTAPRRWAGSRRRRS